VASLTVTAIGGCPGGSSCNDAICNNQPSGETVGAMRLHKVCNTVVNSDGLTGFVK